jgi:hypothetical protein
MRMMRMMRMMGMMGMMILNIITEPNQLEDEKYEFSKNKFDDHNCIHYFLFDDIIKQKIDNKMSNDNKY